MRKNYIKSFVFALFLMIFLFSFVIAAPVGPDDIEFNSNETKTVAAAQMVNISGGYIASYNLTATIQNPRWKAFIGEVTGSFTLDDSSGSTIYDWTLSSITGRVYSTRNDSTLSWALVNCSNVTSLEEENVNMVHTNTDDNITATFDDNTHGSFYVGAVNIEANSCPTLNTYVNNATQDSSFEEVALITEENIVYATLLEENAVGYDGNTYDFQMIVPENGTVGFSGATAYYLYVEIGT